VLVDLTEEERITILLALWNFKMATGQVNATSPHLTADQLALMQQAIVSIDALAEKVGGNPNAPMYGLGQPPTA